MQNEIYLMIIVFAIGGLWFVWDMGIKKLLLDNFRERLFELRFDLFKIAESGELSFNSEAYRTVEKLLCGLLRYGHRITFMSFVLSVWDQNATKKSDDYVDYSKQIELKISQTEPITQEKLQAILAETHKAVTTYMAVSSLFFMAAAVVFALLHALNLFGNVGKEQISSVLESEAYRAESYRSMRQRAAAA